MKKQYMNPEMEIVEINVPQLLAGSGQAPLDDNTQGNGDALSPRFELDEEGLF